MPAAPEQSWTARKNPRAQDVAQSEVRSEGGMVGLRQMSIGKGVAAEQLSTDTATETDNVVSTCNAGERPRIANLMI